MTLAALPTITSPVFPRLDPISTPRSHSSLCPLWPVRGRAKTVRTHISFRNAIIISIEEREVKFGMPEHKPQNAETFFLERNTERKGKVEERGHAGRAGIAGTQAHFGCHIFTWYIILQPGELALSCNPSYLGGQNCGMAGGGEASTTRQKIFCVCIKVPLIGDYNRRCPIKSYDEKEANVEPCIQRSRSSSPSQTQFSIL